tara:strand:+ start:178 stop:963 length:786 start_codon:yes stop_codon:yes gene_type:complete
MEKKISVLMTVFNAEKFIKESISSILNQSYRNFELIIVDDFSKDNSSRIISSFSDDRIKFFNSQNKLGRTKALNFGLKKCSSDFIAIQDADDISNENRLMKAAEIFENNIDIGLVCSDYEIFGEDHKKLVKTYTNYNITKFFSRLKYKNLIPHSSIMFKRDYFEKDFLYDESYIYAQDYNLILKFLKRSKIFLIREKLVKIRNHKDNMSNAELYKTTRIKEDLRLLRLSENYFNSNFKEALIINFFKIKNYLKLILNKLGV